MRREGKEYMKLKLVMEYEKETVTMGERGGGGRKGEEEERKRGGGGREGERERGRER